MKTIALCMVGFSFSSAATADWTLISTSTGTSNYSAYIDADSLRPVGSYVRVWALTDNEADGTLRNGTKYRSVRSLMEYDCANDQSRTLAISYTDGQMGKGVVVFSDMDISKPSPWQVHIPGSNGQVWARVSCNFPSLIQRTKNWTPIGSQNGISISIDKSSQQRTGEIVKIRILFDYDSPLPENGSSGLAYMSTAYLAEFDCSQITYRDLTTISYTRQKAEGKLTSVYSEPDAAFQVFPPGSVIERPFKLACPSRPASGS